MRHSDDCPTGGNQVAEAFAWHVAEYLDEDGLVGLLLPAMTLFKDESTAFRQKFFERMHVRSVANFANLSYVLFAGRAERPAAAIVYSLGEPEGGSADANRNVLVYSPLVAEQPANRPEKVGKQQDTWNLAINASDIREIPWRDAVSGEALPWKLAMWGSHRDRRLLESLADSFPSSRTFRSEARPERSRRDLTSGTQESPEPVEYRRGVGRENGCRSSEDCVDAGGSTSFPEQRSSPSRNGMLSFAEEDGRSRSTVSRPPHIIVDQSRRFAVFSDEFIAVPAPQIGISGSDRSENLLKALSLFLTSDFVRYHDFFSSPRMGYLDHESNARFPDEDLRFRFPCSDEARIAVGGPTSTPHWSTHGEPSSPATKTCRSSIAVRGLRPVSLNLNAR